MESTPAKIRPLSPEERLRALLPERLELAAVTRLLPADRLPHMACLDVGMPNPAMSAALRRLGGVWRTAARSPEAAAEASAFLGDASVCCLAADGAIPFPGHSFDAIVVALDMLCAVPDALAFVRECNRILRPDGLLVLSVQARRPFSIADAIRRRIAPAGPHAATFTENSLYQLLKNGFNVDSIETHSRFFLELARLRDLALETRGASPDERAARLRGAYAAARVADALCFWGRRHVLAVSARRRQWSSRDIPALADGRSIGEAVIFNPPA